MSRILLRVVPVTAIIALVALSLLAGHLQSPSAQGETPSDRDVAYLDALSGIASVDASLLEIADKSDVTLPDGTQLVRVKALDRSTGEVVGATFAGTQVVDEPALRAKAAADWRSAHGALSPALAARVATMAPDDRIDIGLWLNAEISPLPKEEHRYAGASEASSGSGPSSTEPSASPEEPLSEFDGKSTARPLSQEQVPAEVRAALGEDGSQALAPQPSDSQAVAGQDKPADEASASAAPSSIEAIAAVEEFKARNDAALAAQVAPVRGYMLGVLTSLGHASKVRYASESAPVIILSGVSRAEAEYLAFLPEIDAIYDATVPGGPTLSTARPTQNMSVVHLLAGYTGVGVNVAVVEGERMTNVNPYLVLTGTRDATRLIRPHPSAVGGMIRSTHTSVRGLAPGVTLYSSNGDDYTTAAALAVAMDWGATNATVLNNSFWVENDGTVEAPQLFDRHMDYIVRYRYDTSAVAAGNFALAGCQSAGSLARSFVSTPGKGYNPITVGNYDDHDTLGWIGDTMDPCSSYNHSGRYKPEVAAVGHGLQSTTTALPAGSPLTGPVGSGTSYASPMVASLAADLIQAAPTLANKPEAIKAIVMASADHNIEGDARLSRLDGVGGINASAAAVVVERGNWDTRAIDATPDLPITFPVYAWKGERVRFVTNWLSNPGASYATDPQPVDLDVRAYRADGTTLITSSLLTTTNFEIVDFIAPASETYQIRITYYSGTWSGSTSLGSAWWRGPWRSAPNAGYVDPKPSPMGTHIAEYPADNPGVNYWRVMGIRTPAGSDNDIELTSASYFADPSTRSLVNASTTTSPIDFIAVDGNHRTTTPEFYRIYNASGTGGYNLAYSTPQIALGSAGTYGPYTMTSVQPVRVTDIYFRAGQARQIWVVPSGANAADLGAALMVSTPGDSTTWTRRRTQRAVESNTSATPSTTEKLSYQNTGGNDWLGLVVYSNNSANASYYVVIRDLTFLPFVKR